MFRSEDHMKESSQSTRYQTQVIWFSGKCYCPLRHFAGHVCVYLQIYVNFHSRVVLCTTKTNYHKHNGPAQLITVLLLKYHMSFLGLSSIYHQGHLFLKTSKDNLFLCFILISRNFNHSLLDVSFCLHLQSWHYPLISPTWFLILFSRIQTQTIQNRIIL